MQLFYANTINENLKTFTFEKEESRHIVRVLRKNSGDTLFVTNGQGQLFELKIVAPNDKRCQCEILKISYETIQREYNIHIAIAPTKNNDRLEWFLEKATELGIDEITPIICQQSERKFVKHTRLERVLIAAMKQSLQFTLPKLNEAVSFQNFMKQTKTKTCAKLVAHCEDDSNKMAIKQHLQAKQDCIILIGPEGDFSGQEIQDALTNDFLPVALGNTRLRTETAGVYAVASVHFVNL